MSRRAKIGLALVAVGLGVWAFFAIQSTASAATIAVTGSVADALASSAGRRASDATSGASSSRVVVGTSADGSAIFGTGGASDKTPASAAARAALAAAVQGASDIKGAS